MKNAYKRWACGFLAVLLILLALFAAVVYIVDPALYFRMPADGKASFFSERYQSAGLVKNVPADTVLIGTSMASNYQATKIGEIFGGTGLRVTLPDGYISEFDQTMDALFRSQSPDRVVFVLDLNVMIRDESGVTDAMPDYLYDRSVINDIHYLLNKDNLYYSAYALLNRERGALETLDESFIWDKYIWCNHITALNFYERPEPVDTVVPADAYLENVRSNLAMMEHWFTDNPDTEFLVFLAPYSLLTWDKANRLGQTDALLTALELICTSLLEYENLSLYGYLMDAEFVEDLDNYCDHIHHSSEMGDRVLLKLVAGEGELTKENVSETIANWREFVVNYDYEKFWDDAYWLQLLLLKQAAGAS